MKKPLHIVAIIQSLGVGGAEYSLVNLINHSDPERFRFSIIVFDNHIPAASEINRSDVVTRHVPKRGKVSRHLVGDIARVLQELQADVVHTHLFSADIWGALAARKLQIPTVCTEHNINVEYGFIRNTLKRWFRNMSSRYVACSEAVADFVRHDYKITAPITVIPNGILVERFTSLPKVDLSEPLKLCIIGRLVEQKGHALALQVLAKLQHYAWQLTIAGAGEREVELRSLVQSLGLSSRVRFTGVARDVPGVLADNAIVLVPSLWEGLGVVAREAMAAGRIVVASDTGGLRESIEHEVTGVLHTPNDARALHNQLQDIFEHPSSYSKVAAAARVHAREYFSVQRMVKQYGDLYNEVTGSV